MKKYASVSCKNIAIISLYSYSTTTTTNCYTSNNQNTTNNNNSHNDNNNYTLDDEILYNNINNTNNANNTSNNANNTFHIKYDSKTRNPKYVIQRMKHYPHLKGEEDAGMFRSVLACSPEVYLIVLVVLTVVVVVEKQ